MSLTIKDQVQEVRERKPLDTRKISRPRLLKVEAVRIPDVAGKRFPKLNHPKHLKKIWNKTVNEMPFYCSEKEHLVIFLLSAKLEVEDWSLISIGNKGSTCAGITEILRPVIVSNAHGFILAHNHPSGDTTPSTLDKGLTERVKKTSELMGVSFHDHIILGTSKNRNKAPYSFCVNEWEKENP